ncbi:MAG TPA: asparaginase domain-containing protein [Solirubrobacteraceae bacterium]|nr:asparaginase domain-containing protein [Solirubrobacteraceae bacterium]
MDAALAKLTRPVRLLAVGGTIAMRGARAVPAIDAPGLVKQVPELAAVPALEAETLMSLPGAHVALPEALEIARRAADAAGSGEGVVITTGTDTMEELAALCAIVHAGPAPIVLTGANRPGSAPGADGAANLIDAVALAGSAAAEGLGTVVAFGGEIHGAMTVRKVDSTGPAAFGSPVAGPLGRIVEARLWLHAKPVRPTPLKVGRLEYRVPIVSTALGDDGHALGEAAAGSDGAVLVALGAGHVPVAVLGELRDAAQRIPVVVTCRPDRSSMLFSTYGFEGAEGDVRQSGAICTPFLSPAAARIAVLCCLGAGLEQAEIAAALAPWDAA